MLPPLLTMLLLLPMLLLLLLLLICSSTAAMASSCDLGRVSFTRLASRTLGCIDWSFILPDLAGVTSIQSCSLACVSQASCIAFAMLTNSTCRRFSFGPFSRRVRPQPLSTCSIVADVFVRNLAGVWQPGALCGAGFGLDFMGTKFKLVKNNVQWIQANNLCNAMGGHSRLAELYDRETTDVAVSVETRPWNDHAWLNALQPDGSVEPDQGWLWLGSGLSINMSGGLWSSGNPEKDANKNRIVLDKQNAVFKDKAQTESNYPLCQCVSPFD